MSKPLISCIFFRNVDDDSRNEGTNLFVTGVSKTVTEIELRELFTKYGDVEKCQIMMDPHSQESRGFGFVNFSDVAAADKAVESLTGYSFAGRTLCVEKARRKRPRTPTPGKYFGPPKSRRGGRPRFDDRYRDRRDYRSSGGSRYDDRRYDDHYRRGPPRYDDRDRYYRDRMDRMDRDRYRYDDRERYPPPPRNDYRERDRYAERRYSRGDDRLPPRGDDRLPPRGGDDRLPPRGDDRLPPRGDDRLPPRDVIRDERPYRDDRDRYAGPPPATDSYRDRDDYN